MFGSCFVMKKLRVLFYFAAISPRKREMFTFSAFHVFPSAVPWVGL